MLLCVAAMLPPTMPKVKRLHRPIVETTQGAGAAKLIAKVVLPMPRTNVIVWQYPTWLNPSNYFWNIETSTSVAGPWTVLVTNASGAFEVTANKQEPLRIYRLAINSSP